MKKVIRRIVLALLVFFVVLIFVIPLFIVHYATKPVTYAGSTEKHPLQDIYEAEDFNLEAYELTLETEDELKLWASEVRVDQPKAIIIYLSGIRQPSVTYFYGHAKWMRDNGYASILLEVRGHGRSEGERVCLGYEEVKDVKAAVNYIQSQDFYKDVPIIIHGVSMGGAIAINAFGEINAIDGLIAMSAYTRFEDVVYDTLRQYSIPAFICHIERSLTKFYLRRIFGEKVNDITPINEIQKKGDRPVLLIASSEDTEVMPTNTKNLMLQETSCEGWQRNTWEHFIVKDCDFTNIEKDTEYCNHILAFLEERVVNK